MIPRSTCLGLCAAAALGAGAAAAQAPPPDAVIAAHARAMTLFHVACIDTLPGFEGAEDLFDRAGMRGEPGGTWIAPGARLLARVSAGEGARQRGCFVGLAGANLRMLDAVLSGTLAEALDAPDLQRLPGPRPGDPALYVAQRDGYAVSVIAARISPGNAMLSLGVAVPEGRTPPWEAR